MAPCNSFVLGKALSKIFCLLSCLWMAGGTAAPFSELSGSNLYETLQKEPSVVSLEELASRYDAFLLDAHGVFWGSSAVGVLPGAADAMAFLVSEGKYVGILTNSTQSASKRKEDLQKYGLYEGVHYHFLLTSGEFANELLVQEDLPFPTPRRTYWVFGSAHPRFNHHLEMFEGTAYRETKDLEEADFIHLAIPHVGGIDTVDPEAFRRQVQSVGGRVPVLCVNPDHFAIEGAPPKSVVRQGSIAALFVEEKASVYLLGKPSLLIYEAALRRMPDHIQKEKIIMIGDTPETDIRGAHEAGLDAALMTKTGVMAERFEKEGPSRVLEKLPLSDTPDFLLEHLSRRKGG